MKLDTSIARARLAEHFHGVLVTLHPQRGPDPQPVVYAIADGPQPGPDDPQPGPDDPQPGPDDPGYGYVGVPIDRVKPKTSSRLRREDNLEADPRGSLLIEHWEVEDWSRLWWVRAELRHVADPAPALVEDLSERLARTVPQYADKPFHRVLVCRIVGLRGWAASQS